MATSEKVIRDYMARADEGAGMWNENANSGWGPTGLMLTVASEEFRKEFLRELKSNGFEDVAEWHRTGRVHIHDMGMPVAVPYCCGHSFINLMERGLDSASVSAGPAKHTRSIINQAVNFIASCANEWAGAQAFSDIDVYIAAYAAKYHMEKLKDWENGKCTLEYAWELTEAETRQSIQEFIFHLNYSTRYGAQPPFSNVTLALTCPPDLQDRPVMIAGKPLVSNDGDELAYGNLKVYQDLVAEAFLDEMLKGDFRGRGFTFPVLTINVTNEFFDHPLRQKVYELTAKYGSPFYQNFINGHSGDEKLDPQDVRSMCCRLQINQEDIRKKTGGIFGAGDNTGSIIVITINLPWLALQAKDDVDFFILLEETMNRLREVMRWKRGVVVREYNKGFLPTTKMALDRNFDTFFCTFGMIGLWECIEELMNDKRSFLSFYGMQLAERILVTMREMAVTFSEEDGDLYNVEAVPGESASYKLARKTIRHFGMGEVPYRGNSKAPYFTNGTNIPAEMQDQLDLVLETQTKLQPALSGGTVVHLYTGEKMEAHEVESVVRTMCGTYLPYFSVSTIYSVCPICGYKIGEHEYCEHTEAEIRAAGFDPAQFVEE